MLHAVVTSVRQRRPFKIRGWVVLPEHLHCIIELPPDDANCATRWRLIKMGFPKALPRTERISAMRIRRGERGIPLNVICLVSGTSMRLDFLPEPIRIGQTLMGDYRISYTYFGKNADVLIMPTSSKWPL